MSADETDDWAGGDERGAASDDITGAAPVSPEPPATGQVDPTVGTEVASEEAPEAPSLKELAERTAVGFAPSDNGPCDRVNQMRHTPDGIYSWVPYGGTQGRPAEPQQSMK